MIDIAVISGSGFYDFPDLAGADKREIPTKFGTVVVNTGRVDDKKVARAIQLSEDKYCSVLASLRAGVRLSSDFEILP